MRRIVPLLTLAGALLVGASNASAALTANTVCGSSCGTFEASKARGALTMYGTGDAWGNIGKGTIYLLDRASPGSRDWSVAGAKGTRVPYTNWWKYSGSNLAFSAYSKWKMRIRYDTGVYMTAVAAGWVRVPTTGTFTLNGRRIYGDARYTLNP